MNTGQWLVRYIAPSGNLARYCLLGNEAQARTCAKMLEGGQIHFIPNRRPVVRRVWTRGKRVCH
jgi:hypothetical protein